MEVKTFMQKCMKFKGVLKNCIHTHYKKRFPVLLLTTFFSLWEGMLLKFLEEMNKVIKSKFTGDLAIGCRAYETK